jgi:hypothetical protein
MTTVAIMQPSYIGWTYYFSMLDQADIFVLLDTVAISRQSSQTRNRVRQRDGRTAWLSIPVTSKLGQPLNTVEIDYGKDWQRKHVTTIKACYQHAPHWENIKQLLQAYDHDYPRLTSLTSVLIRTIRTHLGLNTNVINASDLPITTEGKTERIAAILEHLQATEYLTTRGATYLHDMDTIGPAKIVWHDYTPTPYNQGGLPWDGQLAIIDALAWTGCLPTSAPSATL